MRENGGKSRVAEHKTKRKTEKIPTTYFRPRSWIQANYRLFMGLVTGIKHIICVAEVLGGENWGSITYIRSWAGASGELE